MKKYNPSQAPDPEEWLSLDEFERINLVENFHEDSGEEVPEGAEKMHAAIHVAVENQFASETEPVSATIAKLIRQGLDRHEALHTVGAVLSEDIFNLQRGKGESWNQKSYNRRLEKLSAKRWRKGQW
jgi:hypothetical protein